MRKLNYFVQFNSLRFIGCLWIVIAHFSCFLFIGKVLFSEKITQLMYCAYNALDFFFVLSGFILCHVYQDHFNKLSTNKIINFVKKRFARIYPAYLFSLLLVAWLVLCGVSVDCLGDYSNFSLFLNVLILQSWGFLSDLSWNIPGWSISTEFQMYLVFPFIAYYLKIIHKELTYILLIMGIFLILIYITPFILPESRAARCLCLGYGIFRIVPDFMMGYLSYLLCTNINYQGKSPLWDSLAILAFLAFFIFSFLSFNRSLVIISTACMLISLAKSNNFAHIIFGFPPLVFLGEISYSMYLLQFPLEILSNQLFKEQVNYLNETQLLLFFIGHILALIFVATISYYLIERPMRHIINKRQWIDLPIIIKSKCSSILYSLGGRTNSGD